MFGVNGGAPRRRGGGDKRVGRGGDDSDDAPPTTIMHAAYAGALEVVKALVEVRKNLILLFLLLDVSGYL